jgi:uncharacterized OB-fold protein
MSDPERPAWFPVLPALTPLTQGFFEGTSVGELRIQTCDHCGTRRHPPRPVCWNCHHESWHWQPVSGRGSIWSFIAPWPPLLAGFEDLAPYNVIVVALDEDPALRLVGNLVEAPGEPPGAVDSATIVVGERVRAAFFDAGPVTVPQWVRDR